MHHLIEMGRGVIAENILLGDGDIARNALSGNGNKRDFFADAGAVEHRDAAVGVNARDRLAVELFEADQRHPAVAPAVVTEKPVGTAVVGENRGDQGHFRYRYHRHQQGLRLDRNHHALQGLVHGQVRDIALFVHGILTVR